MMGGKTTELLATGPIMKLLAKKPPPCLGAGKTVPSELETDT